LVEKIENCAFEFTKYKKLTMVNMIKRVPVLMSSIACEALGRFNLLLMPYPVQICEGSFGNRHFDNGYVGGKSANEWRIK
jgi:hypothetical protein